MTHHEHKRSRFRGRTACDSHPDVLEGREVLWYVPASVYPTPESRLWWMLEIGGCDVGTDVLFVVDEPWHDTYARLVRWYWLAALDRLFDRC